ncbi:ATP-binding protein [Saccharopolyspora sp. NPDC002686]|uniref:AlbA family DNA-binding domain-containing protein n=1 Tax=Saccharopolyspora sp. NPDC002686 TaxID=3154541 RepID=UPI00332B4238
MPEFEWRGDDIHFYDAPEASSLTNIQGQYCEIEMPSFLVEELDLQRLQELIKTHPSISRAAILFSDMNWSLEFEAAGQISLEMAIRNAIPFPRETFESICSATFSNIGGIVNHAFPEPLMGAEGLWIASITLLDHSLTVRQARDKAKELTTEVSISQGDNGLPTRSFVLHALRSGDLDRIIGQEENSWLEFKSYVDLSHEASKVELAQDVARFANAESGGILAIGFRTEKVNRKDVVAKVTPIKFDSGIQERVQGIIDQRVYPPMRGLEIFKTPQKGDLCVLSIVVPPQLEHEKPFLVHGAIVAGKTEGVFFSVVRRRGEGSIPVTAREVHSMLAAGYGILRRSKE